MICVLPLNNQMAPQFVIISKKKLTELALIMLWFIRRYRLLVVLFVKKFRKSNGQTVVNLIQTLVHPYCWVEVIADNLCSVEF